MNRKMSEICACLLGRSNIGLPETSHAAVAILVKNFNVPKPRANMSFDSIVNTVFADAQEGEDNTFFREESEGWIEAMESLTIAEAMEQYPTLRSYLGAYAEGSGLEV